MFRLQSSGTVANTAVGEPAYMSQVKTLAELGIKGYRLSAPSPKSPESIAANVFVDLGCVSIRGTVFNSTQRKGEIWISFPSRRYTNAQGQDRTAFDVSFTQEARDALCKAIHTELAKGSTVLPAEGEQDEVKPEGDDKAPKGEGAGADALGQGGEEIPESFK